jgi:hypothetical protein
MTSTETSPEAGRLSDGEAVQALITILALRGEVDAGRMSAQHAVFKAAGACDRLVRGIMGWAAPELGVLVPSDEYAALPIENVRSMAAATLRLGLPLLQPEMRGAVVHALSALNAGQDEPIVRKTKTGRRREAPYEIARAEFDILKLIEFEHGRGRKMADAETDAAQAIGCTREALQKWRTELCKAFGEERVRVGLTIARTIGRMEAEAGGSVDYRPWESDENHLLWISSKNLRRELGPIVERRRAAMAKRQVPKVEDK